MAYQPVKRVSFRTDETDGTKSAKPSTADSQSPEGQGDLGLYQYVDVNTGYYLTHNSNSYMAPSPYHQPTNAGYFIPQDADGFQLQQPLPSATSAAFPEAQSNNNSRASQVSEVSVESYGQTPHKMDDIGPPNRVSQVVYPADSSYQNGDGLKPPQSFKEGDEMDCLQQKPFDGYTSTPAQSWIPVSISTDKLSQQSSGERSRFSKESSWFIEIVSMMVAFSSVASIIAVLAYYDGKPLPSWPFSITINAVIAILATVATASMSVPLSSGLGQFKWIRFKQGRAPLADMEIYDEASRGPLGAVNMIFRGRGGPAGMLGATIMIIGLLLSPFSQQITTYPQRQNSSPIGATNLRMLNYTIALPSEISSTGYIPILPLKAAAYNGLFAENGKPWTSLPFTCITGNCTWNPFETLAVCYSCIDMTEYVSRSCPPGAGTNNARCGWALPSGARLNSSSDVFSMTSLFPGHMSDSPYSTIMKLVFMGTEDQNGTAGVIQPWARQCSLNACVQTISASVTNGELNETITNQVINTTVPSGDRAATLDPIVINGSPNNGTGNTYELGMPAMLGFRSWFADLFANGSATRNAETINRTVSLTPGSPNVVVNLTVGISSGTTFFDSDIVQAFYWNYYRYTDGLDMLVHDLATSVTVSLRSMSDGQQEVNGTALSTESFVSVRWGFISVPCLAIVLSAIFLAMAMYQTSATKTNLWKSSALAVLFHGLDEDVRERFDDIDGLEAKKREAKGVKVKLDEVSDQGGLLRLDRIY